MPVFSSHLTEYEGLGVGKRLREERRNKHMTLRDVAARTGLSEATLSNMENEKVALDLAELAQLADALGLPVATLLPRSQMSHYLIKRADEVEREKGVMRELVGSEPGPAVHHNPIWPLAELFVGKHMEPLIVQIRPLADEDIHFIAHDHEEFMFVLRGQVETQLKTNEGLVTETLSAGDCVYFRSNLPHCHRSTRSEPAETVNVIYSLRGAIDPDDGELGSFGRRFYRRGVYADASREAGEKIGLLRRAHGITVAELAREIDLGARLLTEIERGERSPKLDILVRLARRFRRPIEYFFATTIESQPYYFVQRANETRHLPAHKRKYGNKRESDGVRLYRPLALGFADRGMHPYYVQFVGAEQQPVLHQHHGQEFLYVLDGELEYTTGADGREVQLLHPGDSVFLDSSVPHSVRGHSRNPFATATAEVLSIFWSPLGIDYLFEEPVRQPPEPVAVKTASKHAPS